MMNFSKTILALASLYTAHAFTVTVPASKHGMQPLHAENFQNGLSNQNGDRNKPQVQTNTAYPAPIVPGAMSAPGQPPPAPFAPPKDQFAKIATKDIFDNIEPVTVQGGSLRTCSFDEAVNRVSVMLKTTGRPLNANIDLWQGPDNAPQKMSVYLEDGELRPFRAIVESPGSSNAIAIRNTGQMEFPLTAGLDCDMSGNQSPTEILLESTESRIVQGGAVYTTTFPPAVQSVQIALKSDGRPLNARVELLQGPNNNKQVMEIYTEDGQERPFYVVIDTPGSGNVVRIVNTATVEFPLTASAEQYIRDDNFVDETYSSNGGLTWS